MSNSRSDWRSFVDNAGNFALPNYLYVLINDLMKQSLDFGTMVTDDRAKLRAYKEQVKRAFKSKWGDVAQALESFGLIEPCTCNPREFCELCGGSRFQLSSWISPDEMNQVEMFTGTERDPELLDRLKIGLAKALTESA